MDIAWLEHTAADLPPADHWLSAAEATRLAGMRFAKRRDDWRLGRFAAKRAVALFLNLPLETDSLAQIEIRPAASGAPEVFLANAPAPVILSISHRDGRAACVIAGMAPETALLLGCDLEIVEPRSEAFARDYFTAEEQERVAQAGPADRWRLLALLWSAKESVLKALRAGLRIDTRSIAADPAITQTPGADDWRPLRAYYQDIIFHGWWRQTDTLIRTAIASPAAVRPPFAATQWR